MKCALRFSVLVMVCCVLSAAVVRTAVFIVFAPTTVALPASAAFTPTVTHYHFTCASAPCTITSLVETNIESGTLLILHNADATNNIVVTDDDATTELAGNANLTLGPKDTLTLIYDANAFYETATSNQ